MADKKIQIKVPKGYYLLANKITCPKCKTYSTHYINKYNDDIKCCNCSNTINNI